MVGSSDQPQSKPNTQTTSSDIPSLSGIWTQFPSLGRAHVTVAKFSNTSTSTPREQDTASTAFESSAWFLTDLKQMNATSTIREATEMLHAMTSLLVASEEHTFDSYYSREGLANELTDKCPTLRKTPTYIQPANWQLWVKAHLSHDHWLVDGDVITNMNVAPDMSKPSKCGAIFWYDMNRSSPNARESPCIRLSSLGSDSSAVGDYHKFAQHVQQNSHAKEHWLTNCPMLKQRGYMITYDRTQDKSRATRSQTDTFQHGWQPGTGTTGTGTARGSQATTSMTGDGTSSDHEATSPDTDTVSCARQVMVAVDAVTKEAPAAKGEVTDTMKKAEEVAPTDNNDDDNDSAYTKFYTKLLHRLKDVDKARAIYSTPQIYQASAGIVLWWVTIE
eukprot:jgi/Psemu1/25983/gm1.25983_g